MTLVRVVGISHRPSLSPIKLTSSYSEKSIQTDPIPSAEALAVTRNRAYRMPLEGSWLLLSCNERQMFIHCSADQEVRHCGLCEPRSSSVSAHDNRVTRRPDSPSIWSQTGHRIHGTGRNQTDWHGSASRESPGRRHERGSHGTRRNVKILTGGQEVGSSNLPSPTTKALFRGSFVVSRLRLSCSAATIRPLRLHNLSTR